MPEGSDASDSNGPGVPGQPDAPAPADVAMVDEGQAAPDLTDQLQDRKAWEAAAEGPDLPDSMQADLQQLGRELRNDVDPDAWADANPDDRATMLADANDRIRETYGLPPGEVSYSAELPEGVTGQYSPDTGDITLSSSLLDDPNPDEAIKTLSHENFHDYQQQAIDGNATDPYAESRVDAWSDGQAGYDPEDITAYMANPLESDAFAAEQAVHDGYRRQ